MNVSTVNQASEVQFRSLNVSEVVFQDVAFEDGLSVSSGGIGVLGNQQPTFLHYHNALEIGYCYDGYGVLLVGPSVSSFGPGDVTVINVGVPHIHAAGNPEGSAWVFISIDPLRFAAEMQVPVSANLCSPQCRAILKAEKSNEIGSLIRAIAEEIRARREMFQVAASGFALALCCMLNRLPKDDSQANAIEMHSPISRIAPALRLIAARYADDLTVREMASECCLSEPQFRRVFHASMGCSPLVHLIKFRLWMAASLLENSELPILDIAGRVGYAAPSSFYRHFTSAFGVSPRSWRAEKARLTP